MLVEIRCSAFNSGGKPRAPISFHAGLNTILGDQAGSNSIGKSTFLLIVDFAFGGSAYTASDAPKNVGTHTIEFAFEFDGQREYFSRETMDSDQVAICDKNYIPQKHIPLSEYCAYLFACYKIDLPNITFRDIVGRYFRIYGRENISEKHPLQAATRESDEKAITALLKLFNRYSRFEELRDSEKKTKERREAFSAAQKFNFVPNATTTKKQYAENGAKIEALRQQLSAMAQNADTELSEVELSRADVASDVKQKLSVARRQRGRLKSQLAVVEANMADGVLPTEGDLSILTSFFPEADIKKIEEIEQFHVSLQGVLRTEFEQEKQRLSVLIAAVEDEVSLLEEEQRQLGLPVKLSRAFLNNYAELNGKIRALERQNESYTTKQGLQAEVQTSRLRLQEAMDTELRNLESEINTQMVRFNDFIYDGTHKAPYLSLKSAKGYIFETPDDTGTGASYKSLVVFDISVLLLTPLPALAHDSIILKNIGDAPIERIMELYSQSEKQIFIALDKDDSYTEKTAEILNQTSVLQLSGNGNELFGHSWNTK